MHQGNRKAGYATVSQSEIIEARALLTSTVSKGRTSDPHQDPVIREGFKAENVH